VREPGVRDPNTPGQIQCHQIFTIVRNAFQRAIGYVTGPQVEQREAVAVLCQGVDPLVGDARAPLKPYLSKILETG